jgi:glycosyltransferase involved in cell wall biosynthesis
VQRRLLLFVTDLEIGGTPTVVRELARRLRDPGRVHIEVACLGRFGPVASMLRDEGFHVTAFSARGAWDVRVVHRLNHLLRSRLCDTCLSFLVHANAIAAVSWLFLHDIRYIQSIQTTQPWPRWHWKVQRFAHRAAESIVVPSPSVAQAAQSWSAIPPSKIMVIPNAIDAHDFAGVARDFANVRPFPIGFLGRLDPIKCIPDLLVAVQRLNGLVHLHIYGQGVERHRIEGLIDALGIGQWVTMHGVIDRPQEALKQVGMVVLPSAAEGFGLVLIEAMAAGIPVVATEVAGIRDVVQDEKTGLLVPAGDSRELAEQIARLVSDADLRSQLTSAAKEDVLRRFTWDSVLPQYRQLLRL